MLHCKKTNFIGVFPPECGAKVWGLSNTIRIVFLFSCCYSEVCFMPDGKPAAAGFVAFSHLRRFDRQSGRCAGQSGRLKSGFGVFRRPLPQSQRQRLRVRRPYCPTMFWMALASLSFTVIKVTCILATLCPPPPAELISRSWPLKPAPCKRERSACA